MFALHLSFVLVSLLSLGAAAPATGDCDQLTRLLTANDLHQILGRWIFIEGTANNEIFDFGLANTESMWMTLNTTGDNRTLLLDQALPLPEPHAKTPPPHSPHEPTSVSSLTRGRCFRTSHNVTLTDDQALEFHLQVAHTYHKFLQTCPDCLLMHTYTKENDYRMLYLFGRNKTLAESDLETFRKQAACLQFPLPARFHYDPSKELCPM